MCLTSEIQCSSFASEYLLDDGRVDRNMRQRFLNLNPQVLIIKTNCEENCNKGGRDFWTGRLSTLSTMDSLHPFKV
jgi:hypothetical protein